MSVLQAESRVALVEGLQVKSVVVAGEGDGCFGGWDSHMGGTVTSSAVAVPAWLRRWQCWWWPIRFEGGAVAEDVAKEQTIVISW